MQAEDAERENLSRSWRKAEAEIERESGPLDEGRRAEIRE